MKRETISLADAATLAGISMRKMREISFQRNFEPRAEAASIGARKFDKEAVFEWLAENGACIYRLRQDEKAMRYQRWLEENGDFLRRFLADHAQD